MIRLPSARPKRILSALKRAGFIESRQKGSHMTLRHPDGRRVTIAIHARDLKPATLHSIIKQAGLNEDEIRELL